MPAISLRPSSPSGAHEALDRLAAASVEARDALLVVAFDDAGNVVADSQGARHRDDGVSRMLQAGKRDEPRPAVAGRFRPCPVPPASMPAGDPLSQARSVPPKQVWQLAELQLLTVVGVTGSMQSLTIALFPWDAV
jgi:hypothetical protein